MMHWLDRPIYGVVHGMTLYQLVYITITISIVAVIDVQPVLCEISHYAWSGIYTPIYFSPSNPAVK